MLIDDIEKVIRRTPGLTASQIADILFGPNGYHQQAASICQVLAQVRPDRTARQGRSRRSVHPLSRCRKRCGDVAIRASRVSQMH